MTNENIVREQLRHLGPERGATGEAALDALVAERDEASRRWNAAENHAAGMQTQLTLAAKRAKAAEAERDEAIRLLHGVVEADKQDAMMGHPNPGDSCIGIYISLTLMEYLDGKAKP